MKKIGILTHYYHSQNIGGLLQAYALTAWLNTHGYSAEQIAFQPTLDPSARWEAVLHLYSPCKIFYKLITSPFLHIRQVFRRIFPKSVSANLSRILDEQRRKMAEFEQFIPHSAPIYDNAHIAQANAHYAVFISGSDQVFASYLLPFSAFYGEFAAADKTCIAYGASSDVKKFPWREEKVFRRKMGRFSRVSVREKTLQAYIQKLTGKAPAVVLDPTFLLSSEQWAQVAAPKDKSRLSQKPYVFCYFLGGKSAWQRQRARQYADEHGYELVHLPYIRETVRKADTPLQGLARYDVGPREFITLIKNAACVFTDSFHGLAFSLNLHTNFYVFNRDDQTGSRAMNARITDTLALVELPERLLTSPDSVPAEKPIDFSEVDARLQPLREFSQTWLLDALKELR